VAIKPLAPFIIGQPGDFQGFSIDLLDQIAHRAGFSYSLQPVDTVEEQLAAVQQGKADLARAGISITAAREQAVDFSYPMFNAGLQVLVASQGNASPISSALAVTGRLLPILIFVVVLLLVVAHAIWLVESLCTGSDATA